MTTDGVRAQLQQLLCGELHRRQLAHRKIPWAEQARPSQKVPPGDWRIWLILAGRGFGKTRTGAETIRLWAGHYKNICLLGSTAQDVRRVMLEGASGLASLIEPGEAQYWPGQGKIVWTNGAVATAYSASAYQKLRGPQFDAAWVDELAKFPYPQEAWDQLMFCLRSGAFPRVIVTTTPRPLPLVLHLVHRPDVVVTQGSTFENGDHLPPSYLENLLHTYGETRLGAQEIYGEIVAVQQDALWKADFFQYLPETPPLHRIVIALDPAVTNHSGSDETGIIVAGKDAKGHGHILEDLSGRCSPTEWSKKVAEAFHRHGADVVVAEVNNGGDMVRDVLRAVDENLPFKAVRAHRGKLVRAEPIAALYEQRRIFHHRHFGPLENQLLSYGAHSSTSPDRLDALVWALTELFLQAPLWPVPRVWQHL